MGRPPTACKFPMEGLFHILLLSNSSSNVSPTGTLSGINTYSFNQPGNYTVVVRDNTSFCDTKTPFSIIQNTIVPILSTITGLNGQVLNCTNPSTTLNAIGQLQNTGYVWTYQLTNTIISTVNPLVVNVNTIKYEFLNSELYINS